MFITFEGGEGTGKSTQAKLLAEKLAAIGKDVVLTREPGGTPQGEALRNLLVSGDPKNWSAEAEAMLMSAARDCHLRDVIRPALEDGKFVICDRFADSTRVYQGYAGGCSLALIDELERAVVKATIPDLTLVLTLPITKGLERAKSRGQDGEDRFERKGEEFHRKVAKGFQLVAKSNPARCVVIDAEQSIADLAGQIWGHVNGRL